MTIPIRLTPDADDQRQQEPPLAMQLKRDNSPELLVKTEALFKAGQNAEARTEYTAVLAAHPELTAINRAIAFTYGREKSHLDALRYLDIARAANSNDSTLSARGESLHGLLPARREHC
jgi:predicted Zn-dependent protease